MGKNSTWQTADDKIAQSTHLLLKPAHQAQFRNLLKSSQTPDNILLLSLETYSVTFLNPLKVSTHCYFWLQRGRILALLCKHWFQVGILQPKFMKSFILCCLQNQSNNRTDLNHLPTNPSSRQKRLKIHIFFFLLEVCCSNRIYVISLDTLHCMNFISTHLGTNDFVEKVTYV